MSKPVQPAGAILRALILQKAATPEGYLASDSYHLPNYQCSAKSCARLIHLGVLHRAKVPTHFCRYFTTAEAAARHLKATPERELSRWAKHQAQVKRKRRAQIASAKPSAAADALTVTILADAATPKGFAIDGRKGAQYRCNALIAAGQLHQARVHSLLVRYFTMAEAKSAFLAANPWEDGRSARNKARPSRAKKPPFDVVMRSAGSPTAPRKDAVAVYNERTRYSSRAMPPGRYAVNLPMQRIGQPGWSMSI